MVNYIEHFDTFLVSGQGEYVFSQVCKSFLTQLTRFEVAAIELLLLKRFARLNSVMVCDIS